MGNSFYYGGQAVIEGVMMRGQKSLATAVRNPNGEIIVKSEPLSSIFTGRLRSIPFVRGPIALAEAMVLGIRVLLYSASVALEDEEEEEITSKMLWGTAAFGILIAVGLFVVLPLLIIKFLIDPHFSTPIVGNTADGVIRLIIFLIYLKVISLMPDIRRVFAYHGAEHKTINAYEAGEQLEVENVRKYSTAHSRCGTSFLLIVLVIAIIAHAFLGDPDFWLRFLQRLAILPLIAAVSYEILRFNAAHIEKRIIQIILIPGMALQKLTTREPDDEMIEVAIAALQPVLADDAESLG